MGGGGGSGRGSSRSIRDHITNCATKNALTECTS